MNKVSFKHILTGALSLTIGGFIYCEQNLLQVDKYEIYSKSLPKNANGLRIVHLSDLHNKNFGRDNHKLFSEVAKLSPDIVVMTGDMVSHGAKNFESYLRFAKKLAKAFPLFFVSGNHECSDLSPKEQQTLIKEIEASGGVCLDNKSIPFAYNGSIINIAGISYGAEYYRGVRQYQVGWKSFTIQEMNSLGVFKDDNIFTILLAHNPLDFDIHAEWGADISFGGHIHGGLIRFPVVGGVLSPERRLLPKYKEGIYQKENSYLAVSRGLGRMRLFNRPEILCVTVYSE